MKHAYVISLKYSPGLKKEIFFLGHKLESKGYMVTFFLNFHYEKIKSDIKQWVPVMLRNDALGMLLDTLRNLRVRFLRSYKSKKPTRLAIIYNPHPLNIFAARHLRRSFPDAKVVLFLHEPYKKRKLAYGVTQAIHFALVETIQSLTLRYCTDVILPSVVARERFQEKYRWYTGASHTVNLLIPDQYQGPRAKKYFTIVGHVNRGTGHEVFVRLVNDVARRNLPFRFALVSSSNIGRLLKQITIPGRKLIEIVNKTVIQDNEINEIVTSSYGLLKLDREITQSGVIPVAFMNGTPVIAADQEGLAQHVKDRVNGYIVRQDTTAQPFIEAMSFLQENIEAMSINARLSYEEHFSGRRWMDLYAHII